MTRRGAEEAGSLTNFVSLQEDSKRVRRCARRCRKVVVGLVEVSEGEAKSKITVRSTGRSYEQREDMKDQSAIKNEIWNHPPKILVYSRDSNNRTCKMELHVHISK
jgi:hypothetical protein